MYLFIYEASVVDEGPTVGYIKMSRVLKKKWKLMLSNLALIETIDQVFISRNESPQIEHF